MKHHILLVDDILSELESVKMFLERRGFEIDIALSGPEALAKLARGAPKYSLVVLDYGMENMDGAQTMRFIRDRYPDQLVLIFSGITSQEAFVLPSRAGAHAFVSKSESSAVFLSEVQRLCVSYAQDCADSDSTQSVEDCAQTIKSVGMVGRSRVLADVAKKVLRLTGVSGPVMVLGETGSGKELIAKALHGNRRGPLVVFNCGLVAMNPNMACSDLFGHVKGAFTGATENKPGKMQLAENGTLFLDEFYALPAEAQVGLLRAIEEKKISPLGSNKEIGINCRIVVAAKPNLPTLAARGLFKSDLFFRVAQNQLVLPSLAERPEDIRPLVAHFCKQWAAETGETKQFHEKSYVHLERYLWPGNVRQLRDVVYGLLNLSERKRISPREVVTALKILGAPSSLPSAGTFTPLEDHMLLTEREHLLAVMAKSRSIRDGASRLRISPAKAFRLMHKHGLTTTVVGTQRSDMGRRGA